MGRRLGFGREKRLMLGFLALIAPLPLPFNETIGWGLYLAFSICVVAFLVRTWRGAERWLPIWAANVLALAYLPFLGLDLFTLSGGVLVGPVLHLGMFAVLVKLWSLRQERDKWHAALGIFFLFVAASATSVHLSVALYLAFFLAGILLLLARFAFFHLLTGFGHRDSTEVEVPMAGFIAFSVVCAVILAVPLFALLPRVNNPYIGAVGRGFSGGSIGVSGFSDEVTLDSIGALRTSREVALRLTYDGAPPPREIRLKGGAFDQLVEGRWQRSRPGPQINGEAPLRVRLFDGAPAPRGTVEVWLQPLFARGLPVPVETLDVEVPLHSLSVSDGGALSLAIRPSRPLRYRAWLAAEPRSAAANPVAWEESGESGDRGDRGGERAPATLDASRVSPAMVRLAAEVAGEGTVAERAERLERFFVNEFDYTLSFVGRSSADPLEDFLFTDRRGHCEYFASALVLLLRAEGIHARLATGFLGGEINPLGYVVVRQSNAHAWVEAWMPGEGWRIFDPTPPAGRPGMAEQSWASFAGQAYDSAVFQWERYVLSYGVEDQVDFLYKGLRQAWALLTLWREGGDEAPTPIPTATLGEIEAPVSRPGSAVEAPAPGWPQWLALTLLAVVAALLLWRHHRTGFTATRAYRHLRHQLRRVGLPLTDATGPLDLRRRAVGRWPALAQPAGRLVELYLRESFGGRGLDEVERREAREALRRARQGLRGAG